MLVWLRILLQQALVCYRLDIALCMWEVVLIIILETIGTHGTMVDIIGVILLGDIVNMGMPIVIVDLATFRTSIVAMCILAVIIAIISIRITRIILITRVLTATTGVIELSLITRTALVLQIAIVALIGLLVVVAPVVLLDPVCIEGA